MPAMRRFTRLFLATLLVTACSTNESGGPAGPGVYTGGPTFYKAGKTGANGTPICAQCHNASSGAVLTITGPQTVTPGSTNQYIARITGGPAVVGGVDINVTSGTLDTILGQGTRILRGEIVQSAPKAFAGGAVSFAFKWTAPSTAGSISMFGAGASANGNNIETGDAGDGAATRLITVQAGNTPPVASFTVTCTPARACTFTSTSTDSDGSVVAWLWTTPSGARTFSTAASWAHTFTAPKSVSLKLTVTDNSGATASVIQPVVVP